MRIVRVAILTYRDDLHALLVQKILSDRYSAKCWIIETDRICASGGLTWSAGECTLPTSEGELIDVSSLDLIWCRRFNHKQVLPKHEFNEAEVSVINNDCETALFGLLANTFHGIWISDPDATLRAENKLVQLQVAVSAGFKVPRTLVSQNPNAIKAFCSELAGDVIVKVVRGTHERPLFTSRVTDRHLAAETSMTLAPAIYQELISGSQHIRAHCFGSEVQTMLISSEQLDWRRDNKFTMEPITIEDTLQVKLCDALARLRLKMGIVDLKIGPDNEVIWLEINPQGQFLFAEALGGVDLKGTFARFLFEEAKKR